MIRVLAKEIEDLVDKNPQVIAALLQSQEEVFRVVSDDGTRMLAFWRVHPK